MKPTGVRLLLITISFFCIFSSASAAVFTVTTQADSGPGSLRDAITKANSNGITEKDYIYFNISVTSPDRPVIVLNSDLPALSSNVVVDASTQSSSVYGVSTARVLLMKNNDQSTFYGLRIDNATGVEIYGLVIATAGVAGESYGILISGTSSDITIGGTGKGNVIYGFKYGIYGVADNADPRIISNVVIQSNIIGLKEDGLIATDAFSCYQPVLITRLNGVTLGGNRTDLANTIAGTGYGVYLSVDQGNAVVAFNKIGTDVNGTTATASYLFSEQYLGIAGSTNGTVSISDNLVAGQSVYGIGLFGLQNGTFWIQRNKIGTEVTGVAVLGQRSSGILIRDCAKGVIGGTLSDKNIIAGCYDVPVSVGGSYRVTVSQNEMFCNNNSNIVTAPANSIQLVSWNPADGRAKPFVHVLACNATTISGLATPGAKMEAFVPYRCGNGRKCDGRNYIETFFAGADGKWSYALKGRDGVIFSATDAAGATSDYSNPVWSEDISQHITHTACGKNSGSIINTVLYNATPFHWEDENGNTVGTDTSLLNVPAGKYRLVMYGGGCNKPECVEYSPFFEVEDKTPLVLTGAGTIRPATCGFNNGSISGLQFKGINLKYTWHNATAPAVTIGTNPDISNLAPGSYYLLIADTVNGCTAIGGPFEIKGINAPVLDVSALQLQNAACSQSTGSITGLKVTGTGTLTYTWTNASGQTIGSTPELINIPAGTYTLSFSDESTCPAAPSQPFVITAPGEILIDRTRAVIGEAACTVDNGSVTGLQATNAESVRWLDINGILLGSSLDLVNRAAGVYRLEITNTYGCNATLDFNIPQHEPALISVVDANTKNPVCNLNNGSVTAMILSGGTPTAYRWLDKTDTEVSNVKDLLNVGDGLYRLYVTDVGQCEQLVTTVILKTPNLPAIDATYISIIDDVCSTTSGLIAGVGVTGQEPLSYAWLNTDSVVVSTGLQASQLPGGYNYTLRVTDGYGCIVYGEPVEIHAVDILLLAPKVKDVVIIGGMTAHVSVSNVHLGNYNLFRPDTEWSDTNTTGQFNIDGITGSTTFGINYQFGECVSPTTYFKIDVIDAIKVYAPTAFSPNGDGQNDIFKPKGVGVSTYTLFTVLDRWGNAVFTTKDINTGWDGTFKGKRVEAGGYVWLLQGIDILGQPVQQKGAVLVVY
jgi:gliding motility-associated-like protein